MADALRALATWRTHRRARALDATSTCEARLQLGAVLDGISSCSAKDEPVRLCRSGHASQTFLCGHPGSIRPSQRWLCRWRRARSPREEARRGARSGVRRTASCRRCAVGRAIVAIALKGSNDWIALRPCPVGDVLRAEVRLLGDDRREVVQRLAQEHQACQAACRLVL